MFTVVGEGFADDGGSLRFEIGTIDAASKMTRVAHSGAASVADVSGLPAGNTTVYVCARDSTGAQLCQQAVVTVQQKPAGWDAMGSLQQSFGSDSQQQAGSQQQLAGKAQLFSTIVGSVLSSNGSAADSSLQQAIRGAADRLVSELMSEVQADDPEGLQQLVSSLAVVASAAPQLLSPEAKEAMNNLVLLGGWPGWLDL
jgi:hypothetical protein